MSLLVKRFIDSRVYHLLIGIYLFFILILIVFSAHLFSPFRSFTNSSNSMSPAIDTGSVTVVKKFDNYRVGDPIAYYSQTDGKEEIVTHRVTDIGGNVYLTKGDANQLADREIVRPRLVIGKVVSIIPYLGYLISFAKSAFGTWLTIILPALIIISIELVKIWHVTKRKTQGRARNF